jgi:YegS/Rv2252/BmrU family lipid kinase
MRFKRAFIIYNPTAGRHRGRSGRIAAFQKHLGTLGIQSISEPTAAPHDAARLVRQALALGDFDLLVVHGGDGTINEALQELVGKDMPLAIWPGGTANVLARDLGLPFGARRLASVIAHGVSRRVSVGRAGKRYFFLMAGIGLDASIVKRVNYTLKRRVGLLAYWFAGFHQLMNWRPQPFTLRIAGVDYPATFAAIGNSAGYGGGLKITSLARLDEHCLDVCIFSTVSRLQYLRYLISCYSGKPTHKMPGVVYLKADQVEAITAKSALVQVDGELMGSLPMTFDVVSNAVSLVVP